MKLKKTRGEVEAEITREIIRFEKETLGRGPLDARAFLVNNMILIRLRGVLTQGDRILAETREGQMLLKETRRQIFEASREIFDRAVQDVTGCQLISFHTDICIRAGERIIVLTVDRNLDELF